MIKKVNKIYQKNYPKQIIKNINNKGLNYNGFYKINELQ